MQPHVNSGWSASTSQATGTDLIYQWYVDEGSGFNPVTDGGIYFGATIATLQIFNSEGDEWIYIHVGFRLWY